MELMNDEQLVWRGRPTWRSVITWYLKWLPLVVAPVVVIWLLGKVWDGAPMGKAWLVTIILALGFAGYDAIRRWATTYTVTTERLHIRRGIISRHEQSTRTERVQNLNTHQDPLERLLRVGDLDFDTAGAEAQEADFRFDGVSDPHEIARQLQPYLGHGPSGL